MDEFLIYKVRSRRFLDVTPITWVESNPPAFTPDYPDFVPPPTFIRSRLRRKNSTRWRKLLKVVDLDFVDTAEQEISTDIAAWSSDANKKRRSIYRLILTVGYGDVMAEVRPSYPGETYNQLPKAGQKRKLLREADLSYFPATPAVSDQPISAAAIPNAHYVKRRRWTQRLDNGINLYPETPSAEVPISYMLLEVNKRRKPRKARFVEELDVYTQTPAVAEQPEASFRLAEAIRSGQNRKVQILVTVNVYPLQVSVEPFGGLLFPQVKRVRFGRRMQTLPEYDNLCDNSTAWTIQANSSSSWTVQKDSDTCH